MSCEAITWAFQKIRQGEVPGGVATKVVFLVLAGHVGEDRECRMSLNTLSRYAGVSRTTVSQALGALVKAGLVSKTARRSRDSREWYSNVYRLAIPEGWHPDGCDECTDDWELAPEDVN